MSAQANITRFPGKGRVHETALAEEHKHLPSWSPSIDKMRREAFQQFLDRGLPEPGLERWKYTNLTRALGKEAFAFVPVWMENASAGASVVPLRDWAQDRLVESLSVMPDTDDDGMAALWALNTAFLQDGFAIDIPDNAVIDEPLNLIIRANEGFSCPRLIIRLGRNAALTVTERHDGQGQFWKNGVTQIVLGENASLQHYRMQDDSAQAFYTQSTHIVLGRDARYEGFTLTTGGTLSRNQIHAELNGPGADCHLNGINLQRGTQQADTTMLVEHRAPHCTSNQFLRTVLDNQSRGVYQGKVYVHREAQKTDGYQLANTLLLSEGAEMDTKPELEIYADDVKCSHGATTGRLDEDPLFYMRARGIPQVEARALLIEAFLAEVIDKVSSDAMRPILADKVRAWLG